MVAPLRYGAGMKGKITQALAAGLPVVTTPIGAEGLEGHDEECLLVADDPMGLATHTIRAWRDDELWRHLSRTGQELISERCSAESVSKPLSQLLAGKSTTVSASAKP